MKTFLVIGLFALLIYLGAKAMEAQPNPITQPTKEVPAVQKMEPKPEPMREEPESFTVIITEEEVVEDPLIEESPPKPRKSNAPVSSIEKTIADVFRGEEKIALAVAKAESGLNPKAVNWNRNGSKDVGVFQINDKHGWSTEERFDWEKNIRMAKDLRDRYGWTEWTAFNNQSYRNYL